MKISPRKILGIVVVVMLSLSLFGCANSSNKPAPVKNQTNDKQTVTKLVTDFGKKLQTVSLTAPENEVKASLNKNYKNFVSADLLAKWQSDPTHAPGREVSSPWPDRIKTFSVKKTADGAYEVKGEIIYITSTEVGSDKAAAKQPITCTVKKLSPGWRIDMVALGEMVQEALVYSNPQYGFSFALPDTWRGYTIVEDKWEGEPIGEGQKAAANGPELSIRHPQWTQSNPRQDIPIMIFTLAQWQDLQQEKFHIGAAPMGPSELGRNSQYVFALPARYNFAFPTGYEEVENILAGKPLKTFEPK